MRPSAIQIKFCLSLLVATTAIGSTALAELIEIGTKTELRLGHGINPATEQSYEKCIDTGSDETVSEDQHNPAAAPGTGFKMPVNIEQITSYEKMDHYSSTDVSANAHYAFASGGFSYSGQNQYSLFSDRAAVGIEATADYGRWYLKHTTLKPEYLELYQKDPKRFSETCGTEYVVGYRLGQGVRVVMMTSSQITKTYESLKASVSASIEAGKGGGGFAGTFMNTAANLLKTGSLQINFSSYGGGSLNKLSELIRTETDAEKFRDLIANFLSTMTPANAVRTHYITRPYFHLSGYDPLLTEYKRRTVKNLYADFRLLYDNLDRLNQALDGDRLKRFLSRACLEGAEDTCRIYIDGLEKYRALTSYKLEKVRQAVRTCAFGDTIKDCQESQGDQWEIDYLTHIIWPAMFRYQLLQSSLDKLRAR